MTLIRPRLTDYFGVYKAQSDLDFAIPFLDEDIPLYVDPFLLWKSPSQQDQALHTIVINSFNNLNTLLLASKEEQAREILVSVSECPEVGLGQSKKRRGHRIGSALAGEILSLFRDIDHYRMQGFSHFEEIQLYVADISKDRISDICCSFLKSFLIDYTIQECQELGIALKEVVIDSVYDSRTHKFISGTKATLPTNPDTDEVILLVPKRWLRLGPWIGYDDYFSAHCPRDDVFKPAEPQERVKVLRYNREHYGVVRAFVEAKERTQADCHNDPLFTQIPVISAKRKLSDIRKLPTGKSGNADKLYEDLQVQLLTSLLYPHLDFAAEQSRTDSGALIRDLILYNNRKIDFLEDTYRDYDCRQLVLELKNVAAIEREHINQLNRYLDTGMGRFGVLVTRQPLSRAMFRNTIDLWSGQRRCIITLTDEDIELMVNVFESKQRSPIEIVKRSYLNFRRACPS